NGVVGHHGVASKFRKIVDSHGYNPDHPMLVRHLRGNGMKTVAFSTFHERHCAWWYCDGWEEIHAFSRKRGNETADEASGPCVEWLRRYGAGDNWFLHFHIWDAHTDYRVPAEWLSKFRDQPGPDWPDQAEIDRQYDAMYGQQTARQLYHNAGHAPPTMPREIRTVGDLKWLVDGYDGSIAYADHHVGLLLDELERLGVLDDTAVIVSGDHGDSFGEHGQYKDHGIANDAVHNIPLVVRWPGMTGRGKIDALVYQLDLCPTLCELLDIETPPRWDGRSFGAALRGDDFAGQPFLVMDHGIYTLSRTVRTEDWAMMRMLHPGLYPYMDDVYLYDMTGDPHQTTNLAGARPEKVNELDHLLCEWRQEQVTHGGGPDPLEAAVEYGPFHYGGPRARIERLEAEGRPDQARELSARMDRCHPKNWMHIPRPWE
ncbi:MAG TPA: sulfatase-like hydrolase/transferase, partial [Candidatus Hydrogenedentes bacterium]|nr:sulfatase-like hydrolase/transferase [Candidatus Hydrogenedentota bacterium]